MQGNIISKRNPYLLNKEFNKSKKLKYMTKLSNIIELLEPIQSSGIPRIRLDEFNKTFTLEESSLSMNIEPNTKYSIKLNFDYEGSNYNYITYTITSSNQKTLTIEHDFSDTNGIKIIIEFLNSSKITITTDSNYKTGLNAFDILEINKINISENYSSYKIKSDNCLFKQGTDGLQKVNVDLPYTIYGYFKYRNNLFMVTSNGFYYCANPYETITLSKENIYSGDTTMLIAPHTIKFDNTNNGMIHNLDYTGKLIVSSTNPSNKFYSSNNGISWTQCSFEDIQDNYSLYCTFISYVNNKYFMGTNQGLYYSNDAVNWYKTNFTTILTEEDFEYFKLPPIIYNSSCSIYVLNNTKGLYYSKDGITWNYTHITGGFFIGAYAGNYFLIPDTQNNSTYNRPTLYKYDSNSDSFIECQPHTWSSIMNAGKVLCMIYLRRFNIYYEYLVIFETRIYTIIVSEEGYGVTLISQLNHYLDNYSGACISILENNSQKNFIVYIEGTDTTDGIYTGKPLHIMENSSTGVDEIITTTYSFYTEYEESNSINCITNTLENNVTSYNFINLIKKYKTKLNKDIVLFLKRSFSSPYEFTLCKIIEGEITETPIKIIDNLSSNGSYKIIQYDDNYYLIILTIGNKKYYYKTDALEHENFTELDSSLFPDETLGPLAYYNGICFTPPDSGFENKQYMYMHGQPPEIEGYTEVT